MLVEGADLHTYTLDNLNFDKLTSLDMLQDLFYCGNSKAISFDMLYDFGIQLIPHNMKTSDKRVTS